MNGSVQAVDQQLPFFHNTTHMKGAALIDARLKATSQTFAVLQFFRRHPGEHFTPYDVRKALFADPMMISEVKRSITNLTKTDPPFLVKTTIMKPGDRGRENHTWKLNT